MNFKQEFDDSPIAISVLIVNFNGKHLLEDCIDSICNNLSIPYEIIVVDNASSDGSAEFVRAHYPKVKLITHGVNAGFTGGNNIAASYAKGRYLLLLNTDTVINSQIDPLVDLMDQYPDCGALGCRLRYADGRQQESIGLDFSAITLGLSWVPINNFFQKKKLARRTESAKSPIYSSKLVAVDWVSGAFLITPRSLWEKMGGLDESYFMYMEDVDYCKRIRMQGKLVMYTALCDVTHFEGAGRPWIGERAVLNTVDSYGVYFKKFHSLPQRIIFSLLLTVVFSIRVVVHLFTALIGKDPFGTEKALAFSKAAFRVLLQSVRPNY